MTSRTNRRRSGYPALKLSTDDTPRGFAAGLEAAATVPAPTAIAPTPAPPPVAVDSIEWATAIAGNIWPLASKEQQDRACQILNDDTGWHHGRKILPPGKPVEELRAMLAAQASVVAVAGTGEPHDDWHTPQASPFPPAAVVAQQASTELEQLLADEAAAIAEEEDEAETARMMAGLGMIVQQAAQLPDDDQAEARTSKTLAWELDGRWTTPPHTHTDARLAFIDVLLIEAAAYRSRGTSIGDFLADELDRLAQVARFVGARSPADLVNRRAALDA